jgi:hypothetical protein
MFLLGGAPCAGRDRPPEGETDFKLGCSNHKHGGALLHLTFEFWVYFGLRASDFEFLRHENRSKCFFTIQKGGLE